METLIFLRYPRDDVRRIEAMVEERDSFVALVDGPLYSIGQHIVERDNFTFTAMLDRNVYTRITALVRSAPAKPSEMADLRWAAAILAFCQIAQITLDYASSLQEFAHTHGGAEALKEMERLRVADNSDPKIFIDFALGRIDAIPRRALATVSSEATHFSAADFEKRPRDFRVNYTFALKIAELSQQDIPSAERMIRLLDWMYADFLFGAPAVLFASRYFSPNRHKRMIKSFAKADIENAACDMTFVQGWRRTALKGLETNQPLLLISGDKAVKDMALRMVADSDESAVSAMREVWGRNTPDGKRVYEHYSRLWERVSSGGARDRNPPKHDAQLAIMEELERKVLGT